MDGGGKRARASGGASPAAAAPASPNAEPDAAVPSAEERAAMESLGISHLLDPAQQEAFLRRVVETGEAPRANVEAGVAGLMGAAEAGDVAALSAALDDCSVDATGEDDDTPLHLVCMHQMRPRWAVPCVKHCLRAQACLHGHLAAVQELLTRGANVSVRDEDASTPVRIKSVGLDLY